MGLIDLKSFSANSMMNDKIKGKVRGFLSADYTCLPPGRQIKRIKGEGKVKGFLSTNPMYTGLSAHESVEHQTCSNFKGKGKALIINC